MDLGFIAIVMVTFTKVIGLMTNKMVKEHTNLSMEVYMWVVSKMANLMDKENLIILSPNLMILNTIMGNGKMVYQMEMHM